MTPSIKHPRVGTFAPASAETKPIIAPERGTQAEPRDKVRKAAARPKVDAKPEAKPDPKAKTAATKRPEPKSEKQ